MDGKKLTFDLYGLKGMNFIMKDRETGSLWQQATGEAFEGPLKGKRLTLVNFLLTTWAEWRKLHPDTQVLVPDAQQRGQNAALPQGAGFGRGGGFAKFHDDSRLPDREQVVGIDLVKAQKAYPIALLKQQAIVNDTVGSSPVLVLHSAQTQTTTAFSRMVKGRPLTFKVASPGTMDLVDNETGSKWTMYGECTSGKLKGTKLEPIIPLPSFWFSWAEFFPSTEVFSAAR